MFILSILILVLILIYGYFVWDHNYWNERNVPGPKPVPIFGNLFKSGTLKVHSLANINEIVKKYQCKGFPFIGIFAFKIPQLVILDNELIKDILVRKFNNFRDNDISGLFTKTSEPLFGRNPFCLCGDEWKESRGEIAPGISQFRVKAMFPLIEHASKNAINHLVDISRSTPTFQMDVSKFCKKYTGDVTASCIYGCKGNSFSSNSEDAVILNMGDKLFIATKRIIYYTIATAIFPFISNFYKLSYIPKAIYEFYVKLTKDAVSLRQATKSDQKDFVEHLVQLREKKNISDVEMAAHALTIFFDGFETSGFGLAITLFTLAKHPIVQSRLRDEIIDNFGEENIDCDKLIDLPYLDAVLSETLRLYPPVVALGKLCTIKTELPGVKDHKVTIPKGMSVLIPIYSIHRNPEYYENPETFNPDRFSPENGGVRKYEDSGMYLSFGAGARICLGKHFGKTQIKMALADILRNFEVGICAMTSEQLVFNPHQFILQAMDGLWIEFRKIEK